MKHSKNKAAKKQTLSGLSKMEMRIKRLEESVNYMEREIMKFRAMCLMAEEPEE